MIGCSERAELETHSCRESQSARRRSNYGSVCPSNLFDCVLLDSCTSTRIARWFTVAFRSIHSRFVPDHSKAGLSLAVPEVIHAGVPSERLEDPLTHIGERLPPTSPPTVLGVVVIFARFRHESCIHLNRNKCGSGAMYSINPATFDYHRLDTRIMRIATPFAPQRRTRYVLREPPLGRDSRIITTHTWIQPRYPPSPIRTYSGAVMSGLLNSRSVCCI